MTTVAIVYRKDKLNKKQMAPIHFRIIKDRKVSYISSGIMVPEKFWDPLKLKIRKGFPNSARFNSMLAEKFAELQAASLDHDTLSPKGLKEKMNGRPAPDFFAFSSDFVQRYGRAGQIATYKKFNVVLSKLADFQGSSELLFSAIDYSFLLRYEHYLRETLGNKTNTVHRDMKVISQLFNEAFRQDLIAYDQNPFRKYKLKSERAQRAFLSEEELTMLQDYPLHPSSKAGLHRDMFVFAACAGGLRVSDLLLLKWKNFDGTHIHFRIKKTGQQISLKIPVSAMAILEKQKLNGIEPNHFIFPVLPQNLDLENPADVYRNISSATAHINKNLRLISEKLNLNKKISFHVSRHTWATRALRKGISIDKVSKIMGHAAIRETQIYAKIVNEELDKAMDVFN